MFVDIVDAFELGADIDRPRQGAHIYFEFLFELVEDIEGVAALAVELVDKDNHWGVAHAAYFH